MSKSHFLLCSIAVLLFLTGLSASAQVLSFNGKVIDKTGQPVIGAAVVNTSDRSVGTITDVDGTFTLAAAKGDILEISSLGYTTTKVTVGESGDITVILQEDSEFLSEAVVVGYGTIKKKERSDRSGRVRFGQGSQGHPCRQCRTGTSRQGLRCVYS